MIKSVFIGLVTIFLSTQILAQSPFGINYQGVARTADGTPISSKDIGLRISITQGPNGTSDYTEEHAIKTNEFGLFSVVIGKGQSSDNLQDVDWSTGNKWLEIELDPEGTGSFQLIGTQQMLSVPYALYSLKSSDQLDAGSGIAISNGDIVNTAPDQTVNLQGTGDIAVSGTYPNFVVGFTGTVDDADADPTNEIQTLSKAGNTVTLSDGGGAFTDAINDADASATNELQDLSEVLGQGNDAAGGIISNIGYPLAAGDAVSRSYLESVNNTDYAFKTDVIDTGTGSSLVFDLSNFDFDEGSIISGNLINISEGGVYLFNVKGTSSLNAPIVINVNGAVDYIVGLLNLGRYGDSILLKLNSGDTVVLRANSTTSGESFDLEFFGFKI